MNFRAVTRRDWFAILTLIALWLFFFWRLYTPNAPDRLSVNQSDFSSQYYNFGVYQARRFDSGTPFALWNPYNYGGTPFLADPQASVAYPIRWLFLALYPGERWPYAALEAEVMLHFLLTSLLMYALVRRITKQPIGGLIAALAYTYGGYLSSFPVQQVTILESGTWLPLVLLGIHEATSSGPRRWGWFVLAGLGLGLVFLGGHPQIAMLCVYLSLAYLAYRVYTGSRSWRDLIIGGAIFLVIGGSLAAIMLLPTVEFQQWATRATDLNYASKSVGYPFADVGQIIWSTIANLYAPMYIGIAGLVLAIIAVLLRRSEAIFWFVAGGVALVLGFGGKTTLFQAAYTLLPGAALFRNPERTVMLWSLSLSILAGIGAARLLDGLTDEEQRRLRYGLWGLAGITIVYFLLIRTSGDKIADSVHQIAAYTMIITTLVATTLPWIIQNPAARQVILVAILVFDLFSVSQGSPIYAVASPETVLPDAPWMADMRSRLAADPFARIDGTDKLGQFGSLYALPTIRGTSPLKLAGTDRLLTLPPAKYWDLLSVRYVVSADGQLPVPTTKLHDVTDWSGTYFVYELKDPRPLATLMYAADVVPTNEDASHLLSTADYPIRDKVALTQPPPISLTGQRPSDANVTLSEIGPEHLKLHSTTSADALLLVSIPYYPGWQANVNNQPAQIIRADLGLMAIPIKAGSYDVSLDFRPATATIGAIVSIIALFVTLILLLIWWRTGQPAQK